MLIALLAGVNYYLVRAEINAGERDAARINLGGRQRMLLKSTSLYSLQMVSSKDREEQNSLRDKLHQDIDLMEGTHAILIKPKKDKLSKETEALYFDPPYFLDRHLGNYIVEVRALLSSPVKNFSVDNPHLLNILSATQSELSKALDLLVGHYQWESESNHSRIHKLQMMMLAVTLTVLIMMALVIFAPLAKRLREETKKLIESEERLENAQSIALLGNWDYNLINDRLWWSDEIYKIFGLDQAKTVPSIKTLMNLVHPDDREGLEKTIIACLPYRIDYRVVRPDGDVRYIHEEVRLEKDKEGNVTRMWGTAQDVTERKEMENSLINFRNRLEIMVRDRTADLSSANTRLHKEAIERAQTEEKFRSLFNNAGDAIFIHDWDGNMLEVNDVACQRLGYSRDELLKLSPKDFNLPEHAEKMAENIEILHNAGHIIIETNHVTRNKEIIPIEISARSIQYGEHSAILSIARDITTRKHAEEELRKLSSAVTQSPASIVITDIEGNIEYVNPKFTKTTGYTYEEALGQNPRILKSGEQPPEFYKNLWDTITSGKEWSGEFHNKKKSGELFWESASVSAVVDEEGVITNFLAVKEDITELKKMEEELMKTQKLESVGILAGGIAHDFNNILTAIVNNVHFAKECVVENVDVDEIVELLESANDACFRAKDLTKQLLIFSKGGAPVLKTVLISEMIKESAEFALRGSSVKASYDIPDDLWPVDVDEGQISQVINNLLINAMQAMSNGGIIEVVAENLHISNEDNLLLKKGRYIMLAIKDNGKGISEQIIDKIFDPYFSTKEKGSGLGLSTSYSIINNHQGYINVNSVKGKGTTFNIYLPVSQNIVETREREIKGSTKCDGRILVLEDNEAIIKTLRYILNKSGFEAEYSMDGTEAIQIYKKAMKSGQRFDAVMLDLTIPGGMGGKECIEKLKGIDPNIKGIVCSGYSDGPVIANYEKYGFCDVISKPYKVHEIREKLSKAING